MAKKYDHLSREDLIALHQKRDASRKLGLVWERDEIEHEAALNDDFVALDLDEALSVGDGPHQNLIIEGDNFDALRYLNIAYKGRVKCIYIDPPYNTGNKDFVYNDRYVDKDDRYRHSKWLEFMYRRLVLAKELLSADGVIFVSIDDNEVFSLGMLMKQVFGHENLVATFIWKRRTTPDSRNLNGVSGDHEYVLCYQRGNSFRVRGRAKDLSKYTNPDNDPLGPWMSDNLTGLANAQQRPNLHYEIVHPVTGQRYPPHASRGWIYGPERMAELIKTNRILWPKKADGRPRLKRYQTDMQSAETGYSTVLDAPGNVEATKELSRILGAKVFSFPKPVAFVAELIQQATGVDDLILDFFAGSGTTAHAVLKVNSEDGGRRKVILVSNTEATTQMPDKNICRDICAERVRRVMSGYVDHNGQAVEGLGGEFAYLRATRIPMERLHSAIRHDQVWTALQQLHAGVVTPYSKSDLHVLDIADTDLYYVSKMSKGVLDTLSARAKKKKPAVVFSWQPGLLTQRIASEHIAFEKIPEFLVDRFGGQK